MDKFARKIRKNERKAQGLRYFFGVFFEIFSFGLL